MMSSTSSKENDIAIVNGGRVSQKDTLLPCYP